VFEHADVPYGPSLELGSEASKEVAKKRKDDGGVVLAGKRAKVSGPKAMAPKASMALRGSGIVSSELALSKAAHARHTKSVLKASTLPRASVPPKAGAPLRVEAAVKGAVSKSMATVATSKAEVLRISTRTKRPSADSLQALKGK
jgi:hypothetical protein